ncbi:hypothetical protein GMST_42320 [Geomonas silvestris]|uniref:TonB C-terminal domain-containing protein n=1 Tax=Geomonas silvestris TaxID=2740184 RepID=A0A6V8MPV4_9BACT|nr:energy transducer TonB [Geomonas silvestris]GFO61907.1 hypothetical protein GMST_42320 [Geomonas silvestris]
MSQLTKCCGLSFTLHLVLALALTLAVSRQVQPVHPVTISLEYLDLPDLPRPKTAPSPQRPELRPPLPASTSAPVPVREPAPVPVQLKSPATQPTPVAVPLPLQPAAERVPAPGPPRDAQRPEPATVGSASAPPASAAPVATPPPAPAAHRETAQQHYVKEHFAYIRDLVTRRLAYPPLARRMNWSGKTVVSFVIQEDGSISTLKVVESSRHAILDQSALDTVRAVAPFPKPPVRAEIVLPVHFALHP